jgi:hypothetical protein
MSFDYIHYFLHWVFPLFVAYFYDKKNVWKNYLILLATMLVDVDHLLADPIFDPGRCSIGFHPLHSFPLISIYLVLLYFKNTRLIAIGLLLHMLTDQLDCWL